MLVASNVFADHPKLELPEPIVHGDKITNIAGAIIKWGHYDFFKRFNGPEWDFYIYTPYCNEELGHPFLIFDKLQSEGGTLYVYDYFGKEIDRLKANYTNKLPSLIMYQQDKYGCHKK